MEVYRIVRSQYKNDLSGTGAYLHGGRWNSKGVYALYGSAHISLAVLEILVNVDRSILSLMPEYQLLVLSIPDSLVLSPDQGSLHKNWQDDMEMTRQMGDRFLQSLSHPVMEIPSAVIPEENNFLINPLHSDMDQVEIIWSEEFVLDQRVHQYRTLCAQRTSAGRHELVITGLTR